MSDIDERAKLLATYIIETKSTVRQTAKKFNISKSTVHKDISERLEKVNPSLARDAKKVTWKKGNFVSNTGRKAKNTQDIMFFSKGKARSMRIDKKKSDSTGQIHYMSGSNGMLPTMFDIQPVSKKNKIHQSELPVELCEEILEYVTYQGEIVLDSFAGSGAVGVAALNKKRNCILIEILK